MASIFLFTIGILYFLSLIFGSTITFALETRRIVANTRLIEAQNKQKELQS